MHHDFVCMHIRLRVWYLCAITCIIQFLMYGVMSVKAHQQVVILSEVFTLNLYYMIFYYFLVKNVKETTER